MPSFSGRWDQDIGDTPVYTLPHCPGTGSELVSQVAEDELWTRQTQAQLAAAGRHRSLVSELGSCLNLALIPFPTSPVPNKPYGFCGRKAPWNKKEDSNWLMLRASLSRTLEGRMSSTSAWSLEFTLAGAVPVHWFCRDWRGNRTKTKAGLKTQKMSNRISGLLMVVLSILMQQKSPPPPPPHHSSGLNWTLTLLFFVWLCA